MSDNPVLEPAEQFYGKPEESNLEEIAEAPVTEQETQEPEQDVETIEKPAEIEAEAKTEAEEAEAKDDEETTQYVEIDGKEISLDDVRKGLDSNFMQSDYTKKTTDLADERKSFEAERESDRENLLKSQSEVSEMRDTLAVLVAEDEEIDWAELKEDDPDRYIELKEKADKRKEALAKVKVERETPADDPALIQAEASKLHAANPDWLDKEGKPTQVYTDDTNLMNAYAAKAGFTAEEFKGMTRAHYMTTILKAAKYDQIQEKGRKIKDKREKVPVVTKPKAAATNTQSKPMSDIFYGEKAG